ncbi:MAG: hypothetical protein HKP21_11075 [Xanthomonadales bacterium]|nr:hypothetical protein [Gammaproteobacteria bacterium]MBT8074239.1 hypothetical protein [Gammaproteobacteria bacterium]NNK05091.1 hypothetical protein [Xanthomonadales bacterium]NNK97541.1 hypothetical protein [Xanthomonadales bacterium]
MKFRHLLLPLTLCFNTAWADFSNATTLIHPLYVAANEPFIVDIRGDWPDDCHPGEQKPVVSEYTGDTALVEFETIVEHIACNDVVTPYRVLIDMSDVVGSVEGEFQLVDMTVRFGGAELEVQVPDRCIFLCDPPPPPRDIKPEAGLFYSAGLEKQGLLLARQNQRMGVYPLIYDESGSSEWLFGGDGIVEDVFFAELYELSGGQCLGCPPPDEAPEMDSVGKVTLLMDSQGLIQVRVNDGLFTAYETIDFGYGSREVGGNPNRRVPDLSGRWAFVEDIPDSPYNVTPGTPSEIPAIPLVFNITLESVTVIQPPLVTAPPTPGGHVEFSIRDPIGTEVRQMQCDYNSNPFDFIDAEMVCEVTHPDINSGDTMYKVTPLSVKRLAFDYVGPIISVPGIVTRRIAVRVD